MFDCKHDGARDRNTRTVVDKKGNKTKITELICAQCGVVLERY